MSKEWCIKYYCGVIGERACVYFASFSWLVTQRFFLRLSPLWLSLFILLLMASIYQASLLLSRSHYPLTYCRPSISTGAPAFVLAYLRSLSPSSSLLAHHSVAISRFRRRKRVLQKPLLKILPTRERHCRFILDEAPGLRVNHEVTLAII